MNKYVKTDDIRNAMFDLNKKVFLEKHTAEPILRAIGELPTIDIVHCKDCKHLNKSQVVMNLDGTERRYKCDCIDEYMLERNFCSYGERIEE